MSRCHGMGRAAMPCWVECGCIHDVGRSHPRRMSLHRSPSCLLHDAPVLLFAGSLHHT
jgi:hypothetical protein